MADIEVFRRCEHYGRCIGCDTKIKNNRFQSYYDQGVAHTSVVIRNIQMPASLIARLDDNERQRCSSFLSCETMNHGAIT